MKVEAVTICIGQSQILKLVVENKKYFDRWIIVTTQCDIYTKRVCDSNNLEYVITKRSGLPFRFKKGCMINDGLNILNKKDWLLQIDCDILLPPSFKPHLISLEKDYIYGCKRINVYDESKIDESLVRISNTRENIWTKGNNILGFFQLFHSSKQTKYIEKSNTCAKDDIEFQGMWSENHRRLLPFSVIHFGIPFDEKKWNGSQANFIKHL